MGRLGEPIPNKKALNPVLCGLSFIRDRLECGPFIRDFYKERSEFTKITLIWNSVFIAFVDELGGWGVSSAVPGHHLAEPNGGFRSWARRFPDHFEVILALFQNLTIFSVFWLYSKTWPFLGYFGRFLDHFEPILARYENLTTLEKYRKWLILTTLEVIILKLHKMS